MDSSDLTLIGVALAIALYVALVNRRRQRYAREVVFRAPLDAVWRIHDIRPGQADWVPQLAACVWADEAAQDMRASYLNGAELRMRILEADPPRMLVTEARARPNVEAAFGDLMRSRTTLAPEEDGTVRVSYEFEIEREPGLSTFAMRLSYPWLLSYSVRLMRRSLEEKGYGRQAPATPIRSLATQIALVAASILWLGWLVGPWAGLGALAMLLIHEYGHVWSMRRHGHETARLYLVPFFGGVAIGSRVFASEAEAVEIFLMGPVFGLLPSLASLGLFAGTADPFFASLAGFLAICNGFNLAPIPPLDGGRVTQSLLRPFGDKAWYVGSALLLLAGLFAAAYFRLAALMLAVALGVWAWGSARGPDPATRPLSGPGVGAGLIAYLALIALHVGVVVWAFSLDGPGALDDGPRFAREASVGSQE